MFLFDSLKAEWLFSQGRGRNFHVGQHLPLIQYLASVCPQADTPPVRTSATLCLLTPPSRPYSHIMSAHTTIKTLATLCLLTPPSRPYSHIMSAHTTIKTLATLCLLTYHQLDLATFLTASPQTTHTHQLDFSPIIFIHTLTPYYLYSQTLWEYLDMP